MTEPEFKRGDLVTLKSGSPVMTIGHKRFIEYEGILGPAYLCLWFDTDANDCRQVFSEEVLKPAEIKP